jgi:hypothetical protein
VYGETVELMFLCKKESRVSSHKPAAPGSRDGLDVC